MTDLISIFTLVFLGAALVLLWGLNLEQARYLHQMANSLEEMHLMQVRKQRKEYQGLMKINTLDWLKCQSGSTQELLTCLGVSEIPAWINFSAEDGSRLVVSPLAPKKLYEALGGTKVRRSRVGSAFEPLLGYSPRKVRTLSRSLADGEYFDLEASIVGCRLGVNWGEVTRLWFYIIPRKGGA